MPRMSDIDDLYDKRTTQEKLDDLAGAIAAFKPPARCSVELLDTDTLRFLCRDIFSVELSPEQLTNLSDMFDDQAPVVVSESCPDRFKVMAMYCVIRTFLSPGCKIVVTGVSSDSSWEVSSRVSNIVLLPSVFNKWITLGGDHALIIEFLCMKDHRTYSVTTMGKSFLYSFPPIGMQQIKEVDPDYLVYAGRDDYAIYLE